VDIAEVENLIMKENYKIHEDGTTYTGQMRAIRKEHVDKFFRKGTGEKNTEHSKSGSVTTDFNLIPHGKGALTWPDGASYTGEIRHGKVYGEGHFMHANGDTYYGHFVDD
jgi:hypothetical protein